MEVDVSSESGSEGDFLDSDALEVPNDHHMLQKVNKLEEYLPFTEEIRQNRQALLLNLKNNALKAVLEQGESLNNWMFAFDHYLTAFGYAFTKDEHIIFVKICLQALDSIADNIPVSLNLLKLTTRSKFSRAASVLANFLPTLLYPEEHQYGYQLWFQEFMELWISLPENGKNITSHNCFVKLFSRLAKDAKGFIDWDPYLPVVFERFKGLFRVDTYSYGNDEVIKLYIQWIVYSIFDASKALDNLQQFFRLRSVHFFISKEKSNSQFQKVVDVAVKALTNRLRSERYKRNWFNFALPASNLNNRLVNEFAKIMMTTVEKIGFKDFDLENLYNLCNISAPILSGQVIEKLDLAYEQICEPKRLTTALQMFSMSLLPILTNEMTAAQYRLNVLPILTSLASNIKHLLSIRSILVLGLPLVDCSHLAETADGSVDDSAKQLLLDTRQLDEFAHEFLRCCFTIIESNNEDLLKMSKSHFSVKTLLHESLLYVLANSSPATTKAILDKAFQLR
ncbi:hypothetical protein TYRP_004398 [Tyrophagus putrescentiae]|nr:hypothetical protein TYRP_004398 [Tyrophagus putrescentiae]